MTTTIFITKKGNSIVRDQSTNEAFNNLHDGVYKCVLTAQKSDKPTHEQLNALEEANKQLERIREDRIERAKRLGIPDYL